MNIQTSELNGINRDTLTHTAGVSMKNRDKLAETAELKEINRVNSHKEQV